MHILPAQEPYKARSCAPLSVSPSQHAYTNVRCCSCLLLLLQLPTMVITAWMYLIFTVALLLQHIYYTRIRLPSAAASDGKVRCCPALMRCPTAVW